MADNRAEEKHIHDKQFLIECLTQDLLKMLVDDYGWDIPEAMDTLFSSKTYSRLENESTGLYYQGSVYVYDILMEELSQTNQV